MGLVKRWSAGCVIAAVASGAFGAHALAGETSSGRSRTVPKVTARAVSESALARDLIYACAAEARDAVTAAETAGAMSEFWTDSSPRTHRAAKISVAVEAHMQVSDPSLKRLSLAELAVEERFYRRLAKSAAAEGRDTRYATYMACLDHRRGEQIHGARLKTQAPARD